MPDAEGNVALWNVEQFSWSLSLFAFALAIGESNQELFDKVFVRLQVTFILLASVIMLVVTRAEKSEYLASIRSRSSQLAEFVVAHADYFRQRKEPLPAIVEREDFLQRVALGFGNLPELKIIRIVGDSQAITLEISENGQIQRRLEVLTASRSFPPMDSDNYFLIHALPLTTTPAGGVEFYSARGFLDPPIRKRIIFIFSLFTGMVCLSTLMIGLVVHGASATIRKQARKIEETQRQLVQAAKLAAVGELAAGVAHEINNPATTILSRASFLLSQKDASRSPDDQEDLEAIVNQAQRIAQITRGLLLFSRPQSMRLRATPIEPIIETALHPVKSRLDAQHISVATDLEPGLPWVGADPDSLARALENLFRNAADAMPQEGTLRIRAATDNSAGSALRLEITDTGMGIAPDNLERIFDPFFTTKEVGKGTGLGLSIVHGIIQEHYGTITVASQPGAGTTFTIILPTEG